MKNLLLAMMVLCAGLASPAYGQLSASTIEVPGKFFVSVDDRATLMLNGKEIFTTGIGESSSPEVTLKPGDRVIAKLHNRGGPRKFILAFVSSDSKTVVSFRNTDFKMLPDYELRDLSESEIRALPKTAKEAKRTPHTFPFKHSSESFWGQDSNAVVACVLRREMFTRVQ